MDIQLNNINKKQEFEESNPDLEIIRVTVELDGKCKLDIKEKLTVAQLTKALIKKGVISEIEINTEK